MPYPPRPREPSRGMPYGGLEEHITNAVTISDDLKGWLLHSLSEHEWGVVTIPVFDEFDLPWDDGCVTCNSQGCKVRREIADRMGVPYWPDSKGYDPTAKK